MDKVDDFKKRMEYKVPDNTRANKQNANGKRRNIPSVRSQRTNNLKANNSRINNSRTNYSKTKTERYTSKKINISKILRVAKRAIREDIKENPGKWKKILATFAIAGLASGMIGSIINQKIEADNRNTITLEQALENQTLDNLGIETETQQQLYYMQDKLLNSKELGNIDLINLSKQIIETQFDVIKEKLAKAYNVEEKDIKLQAQYYDAFREVNHSTKIVINGTNKLVDNQIPERVKTFIELIGDMQGLEESVNNENFDRGYIIDKYKYVLEETSKIAASNIYVNKNGELVYEAIKKSEYEKQEISEAEVSFDINGNIINNCSNITSREDYER